jgi:hypothetical protein
VDGTGPRFGLTREPRPQATRYFDFERADFALVPVDFDAPESPIDLAPEPDVDFDEDELDLDEFEPDDSDAFIPNALLTATEIPSAALSLALSRPNAAAPFTLSAASWNAGESLALRHILWICSYRWRPAFAPRT